MSSTLKDLRTKVDEYSKKYRHPSLKGFSFAPPYDLFPNDPGGLMVCEKKWNDTWPNNGMVGVYAFLDREGNVIYIGKSSMNSSVSARLSAYCGYDSDRKKCRLKHDGWIENPRYVWIVGVPQDSSFEAAALEEYLISEIQPTDNINGITKSR
jgi:hypothetical protein